MGLAAMSFTRKKSTARNSFSALFHPQTNRLQSFNQTRDLFTCCEWFDWFVAFAVNFVWFASWRRDSPGIGCDFLLWSKWPRSWDALQSSTWTHQLSRDSSTVKHFKFHDRFHENENMTQSMTRIACRCPRSNVMEFSFISLIHYSALKLTFLQ